MTTTTSPSSLHRTTSLAATSPRSESATTSATTTCSTASITSSLVGAPIAEQRQRRGIASAASICVGRAPAVGQGRLLELGHRECPPPLTLALHDVRDAERFVRSFVSKGRDLSDEDFEDAASYLMEHMLRMAERFRPDPRGQSFSRYAGVRLSGRLIDWYRYEYRPGSRHGPREQPLSLDAIAERGELDEPLSRGQVDPEMGGATALAGVLAEGDRLGSRPLGALVERRTQRVAGRDQSAAGVG